MSHTQYLPDMDNIATCVERTGQDAGFEAGAGRADLTARLDGYACTDDYPAPLQTVAAGIRNGISPLQFMAGINAVSWQLGNRAFLRWVGGLHAGGQDSDTSEISAPILQDPDLILTNPAPLQYMPKKHKKKGEAVTEKTPAALPQTPPEADTPTGPEAEPGATDVPGKKKKKKKSRVQVALNTLRDDGVEAFHHYIEAEIGETDLLHTLTERISRAEDLVVKRAGALAVVEERMRVLDPKAAQVPPQAAASGRRQVVEKAVIAPAVTSLSLKERDILKCCLYGNAGKLRRLLMHGEVNLNVGIADATPLILAASKGHTAAVRELLSARGIDINLAQNKGGTALFMAAQLGYVDIVNLLLEDGRINVNLATLDECTPLCIAAQHGKEQVVRLLIRRPDIKVDARQFDLATPLFCAAQDGFTGIVELLLRKGANVNLPLDDGVTPLIAAAKHGNTDVCRLLLREPDIKVNQSSVSGVTALAHACEGGYKEIVKLLLRKGADANLSTKSGISPLHIASLHGYTAVVEILLNAGADTDATVMATDEDTYTPYQIARLVDNREIAALLAARRRVRAEQPAGLERLSPCLRPQGQALEDKPDSSTSLTAPTLSSPPDTSGLSTRPGEAAATAISPVDPGSQPTPEKTPGPLETAKQALRQEVLGKLRNDNIESLEGIRLLEDVNTTADINGLCSLYNRLAHIERQKERARRRWPVRGRGLAAGAGAAPAGAASPRFALGDRQNLDADAVESEIRKYLDQSRHRFVSQAVNDMEFGRGKPASGYPGLLHASAGIPGVGSCSMFYYRDAARQLIRIVGIGHHLDAETYRLDYTDKALSGVGSTLRLS